MPETDGIDQINKTPNRMDVATQLNAALAR
jgi:hypothetical protein